jgi:hypothetical protein
MTETRPRRAAVDVLAELAQRPSEAVVLDHGEGRRVYLRYDRDDGVARRVWAAPDPGRPHDCPHHVAVAELRTGALRWIPLGHYRAAVPPECRAAVPMPAEVRG